MLPSGDQAASCPTRESNRAGVPPSIGQSPKSSPVLVTLVVFDQKFCPIVRDAQWENGFGSGRNPDRRAPRGGHLHDAAVALRVMVLLETEKEPGTIGTDQAFRLTIVGELNIM